MTMRPPLNVFFDECQPPPGQALWLQRVRIQSTMANGRPIGEQFDDRYDTEAGGSVILASQSVSENGTFQGWQVPQTLTELGTQLAPRPPAIVDYETGRRYSVAEAENLPALAGPLKRLRERLAELEGQASEPV